jgi:hypothetical protein
MVHADADSLEVQSCSGKQQTRVSDPAIHFVFLGAVAVLRALRGLRVSRLLLDLTGMAYLAKEGMDRIPISVFHRA